MIYQIAFLLLILESCVCQPKPLYGIFDSEPVDQKTYLESNKTPYLLCSFNFKDEHDTNSNATNFSEPINHNTDQKGLTSQSSFKNYNDPVKIAKASLNVHVDQNTNHDNNPFESKNDLVKIPHKIDIDNQDVLISIDSKNNNVLNKNKTQAQNVNKEYIKQENNKQSIGDLKKDGIEVNNRLKLKAEKALAEYKQANKVKKVDAFNKLIKDEDEIFRFSISTHCQVDKSMDSVYTCEKSPKFTISVKRFWFIRKRITIDAKKAINDSTIKYYLGNYSTAQFDWVEETCTFYINSILIVKAVLFWITLVVF